jgi:hypothetical protein
MCRTSASQFRSGGLLKDKRNVFGRCLLCVKLCDDWESWSDFERAVFERDSAQVKQVHDVVLDFDYILGGRIPSLGKEAVIN